MSYIENRRQCVTINRTISSTSPIGMGVSRGYNSGLLLIFIFINYIVVSNILFKFDLLAEETSIYRSDCNEFNVYNVMNAELLKDCNWTISK